MAWLKKRPEPERTKRSVEDEICLSVLNRSLSGDIGWQVFQDEARAVHNRVHMVFENRGGLRLRLSDDQGDLTVTRLAGGDHPLADLNRYLFTDPQKASREKKAQHFLESLA